MTLIDFLRVIRERWVTLLVCLILGAGAALAITMTTAPLYQAKTSLFISARVVTADPTAVRDGTLLSQQRISSYAQLITDNRVTGGTVTKLGLPMSADALAKEITTTTSLDSVIIGVTVTDPSPTDAARIANTVADVFIAEVAQLEQPTDPKLPPPVSARVIQPAVAQPQPISPSLTTNLVIGLLGGLVIGIAAAFVRQNLDRSVKSAAQLRTAAGAPVLGSIAYNPDQADRPLTVHENPHSPRREAFRQLRTNLQFVRIDDPPRVIVVTSALAGEGKTSTVSNLAIAIASAGSRVLVIDADLRRPHLSHQLGVEGGLGLTTVLAGTVSLEQAVQKWWGGTFDVLASGRIPPNPSELLSSQQMASLLARALRTYDIVLIDTPPLLPVTDAAALAPQTDGVLLVVRHGRTRLNQVQGARDALHAVSARLLGTVLTMTPRRSSAESYYRSYPAGAERKRIEPVGADPSSAPTVDNPIPSPRSRPPSPQPRALRPSSKN